MRPIQHILRRILQKPLALGERFFRTDLRYLARGSFWLSLQQGAVMLLSFLLAMAFAKYVEKDAYGTYQYILSVAGLIGVFSLSGLSTVLIRSAAQAKHGALRQAFFLSLKYSVGVVILGLATASYYALQGDMVLAWGIGLATLLTPLFNSFPLYESFLLGKKRFSEQALYGALRALLPTLLVFGVILWHPTVLMLVSAYFVGHVLSSALFYFLTQRKYERHSGHDGELLSYSKHMSVMNIINTGMGQLDKIVIFQFIGAAELAVYLFAVLVPRQVQHLFKQLKSLAFPKLSERSLWEIRRTLFQRMFRAYAIVLPATAVYIFLAPFLYELFFSNYSSSVALSRWYSLVLLLMPFSLLNEVFIAHKRTRELYVQRVGSLIVKGSTLLIFVPLWGVWGVLVSLLLTQSLMTLVSVYQFFRINR